RQEPRCRVGERSAAQQGHLRVAVEVDLLQEVLKLVAIERYPELILQQRGVPMLAGIFGEAHNILDFVVVPHEMNLIIEDELSRKPVCPLGGGFRLGPFGARDIEDRPKHVIQRHKRRRHAAAGAQKLAAVHPELAGAGLGKVFEPFLELSLAPGLRQRIELAVRHHSRGHRRFEVQLLRWLGLRELALAEENPHGLSSLGCSWTTPGSRRPLRTFVSRTILVRGKRRSQDDVCLFRLTFSLSQPRSRRVHMPQQIRAVVVDPSLPDRLAIREVSLRDPDRDEVIVRVTAMSLNRGETRRALQVAEADWRPGWDFAGIVETTAADGSGPEPGTGVVGILPSGAWAERVNCRSHAVAGFPGPG